jgi:hypothetical protein
VSKVLRRRKYKPRPHPSRLLDGFLPRYATDLDAAYVGDALDLLRALPDHCVSAIITSPPYALKFKKAYGNEDPEAYVDWFLRFAPEFRRVLRSDGSLVLEIGGAWNPGVPTRSVYHFELLVRLVREQRFHLAEEFFWFNRTRIPGPTEWVNVQRIRVKDAVTPIWWLSVSPNHCVVFGHDSRGISTFGANRASSSLRGISSCRTMSSDERGRKWQVVRNSSAPGLQWLSCRPGHWTSTSS